MRNERDWHKVRSTHADVLETLERVIAMHPAGGGGGRVRRLPVEREALAAVVPLRPRAVTVPDVDDDPDDAA
jgi:hypothetical protein